MRYLKITPEEYSKDFFGDHHESADHAHFARIRKAKPSYLDANLINQVVGYTYEDSEDNLHELVYLICHFQGAKNTTGNTPDDIQDRDIFVVVKGTVEEWLAKIESALADPQPEPVEQETPAHCLTDRGVWTAGEAYQLLDTVTHPDDASKTYLAVKASMTTSKAVLSNTGFWCEIVLAKL